MDKSSSPILDTSVLNSTPMNRHLNKTSDSNSGLGSGDKTIHLESEHEQNPHNICWTIRDFCNTVATPGMLKTYTLEFPNATPKVKFTLGQSKTGILYLKPFIDPKESKAFRNDFIKFGFAVGPHKVFKNDFTLESPIIQIKNLNKAKLDVLEIKTLRHSYLVDGNLNLIVRLVSLTPKTSPAIENRRLSRCGSKGDNVMLSCSQFVIEECEDNQEKYFSRKNLPVPLPWPSKSVSPIPVHDDNTNNSDTESMRHKPESRVSVNDTSLNGEKIQNPKQCMSASVSSDEEWIFKNTHFDQLSKVENEECLRDNFNTSNDSGKALVPTSKPDTNEIISLGKCWDRDHSRTDLDDLASENWMNKLHHPLFRTFVTSKTLFNQYRPNS